MQNITDIDDKIIKKSQEEGVTWKEISDRYTKIFFEDMDLLDNTAVNRYAKATDYIKEIVHQVKELVKKGFAYETNDGIYYEIRKFNNYGKLSGRIKLKETDGVSRIDSSDEKRGWNDFCLWKFSKSGEPFWETELGKGRPGWHIEDTAITESFFGPQYDIHGGAVDLIFPHHEAEIAQMEAVSGKSPLVRHWMHTGFLNVNSVKMSKSLGNFLTVRDVLKGYGPKVLRMLYLSGHYRSSIEFSEQVLIQVKNSQKRISEFIYNINQTLESAEEKEAVDKLRENVINALDNDFDTPKAMAFLFKFIRDRNIKGASGKYTLNYFREINQFFGFFEFSGEGDDEIDKIIKQRDEYRKIKNFEKADEIKEALLKRGIQIYDLEKETRWKKINNRETK